MPSRNIRLTGPTFEPSRSPTWRTATEADRLRYWTRLGEIALAVKRDEVRRGLGVDGQKFEPVAPATLHRPGRGAGPPLDPRYAESRTYRLLASHPTATGVTLFWRGHGRKSWSTILGYHADGMVHGAYKRDTIGISPAGRKKIADRGATYWNTYRPGKVVRPKVGEPGGASEPPATPARPAAPLRPAFNVPRPGKAARAPARPPVGRPNTPTPIRAFLEGRK